MTHNDITGDSIANTKGSAEKVSLRDDAQGWERIFEAKKPEKFLVRCAANRDGECCHKACPQLRDNEPANSGRWCPLEDFDED